MTSRSRTLDWFGAAFMLSLNAVVFFIVWMIGMPIMWVMEKFGYEFDKGDE